MMIGRKWSRLGMFGWSLLRAMSLFKKCLLIFLTVFRSIDHKSLVYMPSTWSLHDLLLMD
jgi:hypothetical protein